MRALLAGGALVCVQAACSADDSSEGGIGTTATTTGSSGFGTTTSGAGGGGLPPEQELESSYRAPVATGRYVWITNPESGRVAFIDATTLSIELVDAGHAPTYLAGVPDPEDDVAIVLNVLSLDATLLRAGQGGELTTDSLAVPSGGNRWAISADGRWATAWTDAREVENVDPLDGYQDITVLDLHERVATPLAVGYRPVEVGYDVASSRLFAVTQDGVSVIALDAP
ncbi:MAG TPA: hypothetical protein VFB62_14875, partial [Polyangiaceae bacterium]|nr:hypothetical protein [Polyangiaceae bacterium]